MIKTKLVKKEIEEEEIKSINCDRCNKDLGDKIYHYKGGHFIPSFPWNSYFSDSDYELTRIVLCDDCWNHFYNNFIIDPIGKEL